MVCTTPRFSSAEVFLPLNDCKTPMRLLTVRHRSSPGSLQETYTRVRTKFTKRTFEHVREIIGEKGINWSFKKLNTTFEIFEEVRLAPFMEDANAEWEYAEPYQASYDATLFVRKQELCSHTLFRYTHLISELLERVTALIDDIKRLGPAVMDYDQYATL